MPLKVKVKTLGMAREERQLEEMIAKANGLDAGDTVLFPEYGAYTPAGSQTAYFELSKIAAHKRITIITSLNCSSDDLPYADANVNYNTLFIFSRNGCVYSPQAKITPQSFEMQHLDENYPRIDVAPYSHLNRVTLRQNGEESTAFFFICSDLYVFQLFTFQQLKSDAMFCPANFGNGAEASAANVIDYAVKTGVFKQGFLCNTYQDVKKGRIPLTQCVERVFESGEEGRPYKKSEMAEIIARSSGVYPDDPESGFSNFQSMLQMTQKGTFTIPRSRSLENGLKVELGVYEKVLEL